MGEKNIAERLERLEKYGLVVRKADGGFEITGRGLWMLGTFDDN